MFKRKPDLRPYRDPCDPRLSVSVVPDCNFISYSTEHQRKLISVPILNLSLEWLKDGFLRYLQDWEKSVQSRKGFKAAQRNQMLLSSRLLKD